MKYAKMLALAAVAAGALMAFIGAGTASATVLCSTTADPCPAGQAWPNGAPLDFSVPPGGSVSLTNTSGSPLVTCTESTVEGEITNTGSSTETVTGKFKEPLATTGLTWGGCNFESRTTSTSAKLKVHKIAGTSNGTVTSDSEIVVTINLGSFGTCSFGVATTTDVGTITEGIGTGSIFHAAANVVKKPGSGILCPESGVWSGTYVLTTPSNTTLSVSESGS